MGQTLRKPAEARTFSVSIQRPADVVYGYASEIDNLPRWASAFGAHVEKTSDTTAIVALPEGRATIEFAPLNPFGVLDHWVTSADGVRNAVAMRVIPNGDGALVLFTLFRAEAMSAERFIEDCDWVERDLATLKEVLEG